LTTEYETMSSIERFWFASPNMRLRTSTVKRFGGFSTASFCSETRIDTSAEVSSTEEVTSTQGRDVLEKRPFYSVLGW
jgi:hypothetical protein